MCVIHLPLRARRVQNWRAVSRRSVRKASSRSCSAVWREAGARSPEPATPPLGWTGAASPLDRCPGRNVPTHLYPEQDWRGHPSAHISGMSFLLASKKMKKKKKKKENKNKEKKTEKKMTRATKPPNIRNVDSAGIKKKKKKKKK